MVRVSISILVHVELLSSCLLAHNLLICGQNNTGWRSNWVVLLWEGEGVHTQAACRLPFGYALLQQHTCHSQLFLPLHCAMVLRDTVCSFTCYVCPASTWG